MSYAWIARDGFLRRNEVVPYQSLDNDQGFEGKPAQAARNAGGLEALNSALVGASLLSPRGVRPLEYLQIIVGDSSDEIEI